jgi:hypothetical protein
MQPMSNASPRSDTSHTRPVFVTMALAHPKGYGPFDERFTFLFNSYETLGARQPRSPRGMIRRPVLDEVWAYRRMSTRQSLLGQRQP